MTLDISMLNPKESTVHKYTNRKFAFWFQDIIAGILQKKKVLFYYSGLVGRVFANDLGRPRFNPSCIIPKTLKMVLDTSLLHTQQYKVRIKGKVEQSRERSSALPYTSV